MQVLSQFEFLRFVAIWVFEFCHNLSFWVLSQFEFCHILGNWDFFLIWVLSQNEFLSFVTIWVFEFYHNLSFWVSSQFEFHPNLSFWDSSQLKCLSFITIEFLSFIKMWVFEFHHNLSFWVLSQFEFLSFITNWVFEAFCFDKRNTQESSKERTREDCLVSMILFYFLKRFNFQDVFRLFLGPIKYVSFFCFDNTQYVIFSSKEH